MKLPTGSRADRGHNGACTARRATAIAPAAALAMCLIVASNTSAQAQWSGDSKSWGDLWPKFNNGKAAKRSGNTTRSREERNKTNLRLDAALQSDQVLLSEDTAYALSRAINRYQRIVSAGGWPQIRKIKGRWLREGVRDNRVTLLRKRLVITGDMRTHKAGSPDVFDKNVTKALKRFQIRHGIRPKGVVDNRTLRALNVSAQVRLGQLRLNMTRLRDLLDHVAKQREAGNNRYILVNAPAFELQAVNNNTLEISSKVIVGKPTTQTPAIHANIKGLNFFPFWRVPESIANRDLIPTIRKDPKYLRENGIRILDDWGGNEIDPAIIDWNQAAGRGYKFRQDPGEKNALGLVRINMPNSEIVYMHDTPGKKLFNSSARAFSAGCVRVHKIRDVAKWLVGYEPEWHPQRVDDAFRAGTAEDVTFQKPVPVTFAYVTAWGSDAGTAHFRADIYGRDGVSVLLAASEPLPDSNFRLSP